MRHSLKTLSTPELELELHQPILRAALCSLHYRAARGAFHVLTGVLTLGMVLLAFMIRRRKFLLSLLQGRVRRAACPHGRAINRQLPPHMSKSESVFNTGLPAARYTSSQA